MKRDNIQQGIAFETGKWRRETKRELKYRIASEFVIERRKKKSNPI